MAKIRNPERDEFDEIFNLLDVVFNYERIGYNLIHLRKFFDSLDPSDILVMEEDGKIVSHVLMKPYRMYIRGAILEGAEIGAVATDEKYRDRGFASTLLKEALRQMKGKGYYISTLGGYRDRYSRWGWEHGGATRTYVINGRSVRHAGDYDSVALERYDLSDAAMKRRIIEAYERQEAHMIRPEVEHFLTYDVSMFSGMDVWVAQSSSSGFAYLITHKSQDGMSITVVEYGGDPQTLALGLRRMLDERNLEQLTVPSPNWYNEFTPILEKMSEEWSLHPVRKINIIDLERCLIKLLPIAKRGAEEILERLSGTYSVTLRICDTEQKATILFDRGCELTKENGEEELSLAGCDMVRLLFGQGKPSSVLKLGKRMASHFDLIFPLPFYEWATDKR